jgi:eukaryotic-like serine/threonine-protein kinase
MKSVHTRVTEVAGYHLTGFIGSGGMGDVYKAFHPTLNRIAAVKILHQKEMADRFKNEAYIQSSVSHPNIARLYNYAVVEETPCIVMEYVEGETLDTLLHRKGKLGNKEIEKIILQIAASLAYLHQKGILHRDVKPPNFKIQPDGLVKMLDFGIAKTKYTPKITQLGFVVGTTEYMSPEQFLHQVELKSDIWSLGVMTYELVTGYMPFEANNPVTLRSKISKASFTNPKLLVPEVSEKLVILIDKSLRTNPAQRLSAKEIENLLNEEKQKPAVGFENIKPPVKLKMLLYTGLTVLAFTIILFTFLNNKPVKPVDDTDADNPAANEVRMKITVPGIENAVIIFSNGNPQPVPYEVKGREGQSVFFTLHAEGYEDKSVLVDLTKQQRSYEYNLEKIKR